MLKLSNIDTFIFCVTPHLKSYLPFISSVVFVQQF